MKKFIGIFAFLSIVILLEGYIIFTLISANKNPVMVKGTMSIEAGNFDDIDVYIPIKTVLQKPELPNGCEVTSLTAVLNYYGYNITKTEMSDHYLPKQSFQKIEGKLYGPNPYKAYAGDPRLTSGYFAFVPPIVEAANKYLHSIGQDLHAVDISGSSREVIMELLSKENPIVIWVTLDLTKPVLNKSWYFYDTNEYFQAPSNLHVVVLNGFSNGKVHAMNPLEGQVSYDADAFFQTYSDMGSHALMIK
jgi:uncharacterized protein YvpB